MSYKMAPLLITLNNLANSELRCGLHHFQYCAYTSSTDLSTIDLSRQPFTGRNKTMTFRLQGQCHVCQTSGNILETLADKHC